MKPCQLGSVFVSIEYNCQEITHNTDCFAFMAIPLCLQLKWLLIGHSTPAFKCSWNKILGNQTRNSCFFFCFHLFSHESVNIWIYHTVGFSIRKCSKSQVHLIYPHYNKWLLKSRKYVHPSIIFWHVNDHLKINLSCFWLAVP